ncbi:MAG: FtsX-like permease family protein, partial [Chloroflexota bacterium]
EMAILRILGSQQNYLFGIVMVEVAVIGLIGVGFGVGFGQLLTQYAVIPFIESQVAGEGLTVTIQPVVTWSTIIPSVLSAFAVLFVSAVKPARDASKTKVMYAINPGVADNIQLEDLAELRESRPNLRLFYVGLVLLFTVIMVLGLDIASTLGNPALEATLFLGAILLMVAGLGFVFLLATRPLERLVLFIISFMAPRMTYFASRNVGRNNKRNTLISLLVLFSGVLPSFLATQNAISFANIKTDVELNMGAPVELRVRSRFSEPGLEQLDWLEPSFIESDIKQFNGISQAVGLTNNYSTEVTDAVGMRRAGISLRGVTGNLSDVLFGQYVDFVVGDPTALDRIVAEDNSIIISEGLADVLAIELGSQIKIRGAGLDHVEEFTVIGIARRLPGFGDIGRIRTAAQGNSTALVSLAAHQRIGTPLNLALPDPNEKTLTRILALPESGADLDQLDSDLRQTYGFSDNLRTRISEVRLQQAEDEQRQSQVFLLVLTLISFTTAVFGVFAVIYVTIYARRKEIGMMKAVGSRRWELTGMLIIESIAMTVSAALAGIIAGASMGYIFAYIENVTSERPMIFAVDTTVMPFVIVMVVLASIIGAIFSARRIVKFKAIEILRMS